MRFGLVRFVPETGAGCRSHSGLSPRRHGDGMAKAPKLTGDAAKAVVHRGTHLQIIASAGSGKTEVVSQRVADLLASGVEAEEIVAFTFTERAAASLKDRIVARTRERIGDHA